MPVPSSLNLAQLFAQNPAGPLTGAEIMGGIQNGADAGWQVSAFDGYRLGPNSTLLRPSGNANTDTANLIAAVRKALANAVLQPGGSSYIGLGNVFFTPGVFQINQAYSMMWPTATNGLKMQGLGFYGSGSGSTFINYAPTVSGPLWCNAWVSNIKCYGISFYCTDPLSDFRQSSEQAGGSNIQQDRFEDCYWFSSAAGGWQNINLYSGGNNNSENCWDSCGILNSIAGSGLYIPAPAAATMTSGSAVISLTNLNGAFAQYQTVTFSATVGSGAGGVIAGTYYYIVAANATSIQVSATSGGAAIIFSAPGSATATNASDQFLNYWIDDFKFWSQTTTGSLINASMGGHFALKNIDVSGNSPNTNTYIFNLLGANHAAGVCAFSVDDIRVEHTSTTSLFLQSVWGYGNISVNRLDQSSQIQPITQPYCFFQPSQNTGAIINFRDSYLRGQHVYGATGFDYEYPIISNYEGCTLADNPSASSFIVNQLTSGANTGGYADISFDGCRNTVVYTTNNYLQVVDSCPNWRFRLGGRIKRGCASFLSPTSGFPFGSAFIGLCVPQWAILTQVTFGKLASSDTGAFQYIVQTTDSTPVILAGGAGTAMAGSNAGAAISAFTWTPQYWMTTAQACSLQLIDQLGRSAPMTNVFCKVYYEG